MNIEARRLVAVSLLTLAALAGCGGGAVEPGAYRAVLKLPGGELPFGLELRRDGAGTTGFLRDAGNGADTDAVDLAAGRPVQFERVVADGPALKIFIRGKDSRIDAHSRATGLEGEWIVRDATHREHRISFAAKRGASYRFFEDPATDNADISGRWSATFASPAGTVIRTVELAQSHAKVGGRMSLADGAVRRLSGEVHDDDVYLSSFDGAEAYLYKAAVLKDGSLKGEFWSATGERGSWTARHEAPAPADNQSTES